MITIGQNRECFFDDYLIDLEKTTAEFKLHSPIRKECVMLHDEPWEGDGCNFHNAFYDNGIWRMYYLGWWTGGNHPGGLRACYAESKDGIHWVKPVLGLFEFNGSKENNVIMDRTENGGIGCFFVFKDENPACPPEKRYKAIICHEEPAGVQNRRRSLWVYFSPDGIHFEKNGTLISTNGAFDTLNIAFWDTTIQKYRCYYRSAHHVGETAPIMWFENEDIRDIRYIESADFENWTEQQLVDLGEEEVALYTNMIQQYYRAPQMLIGFPMRYIYRREWTKNYDELCGKEMRLERCAREDRLGKVVTDGLFMCSRNGVNFKLYREAFMRPGPEAPLNWVYGDACFARMTIETPSEMEGADPEMSFYAPDNHWAQIPAKLIRSTLRCDGFVSLNAKDKEKTIVTKPFIFNGNEMRINFSTSAVGYLYITLTADDGREIASCETFGDSIDRKVGFEGDLSEFSDKPVVMTVKIKDADLYAIRFLNA